MTLLPRSLTGRLVATSVVLVAVVGLLVAVASTLAMRTYLTGQLDDDVRSAFQRAATTPGGITIGPERRPVGQGPGTLMAVLPADDPSGDTGFVITDRGGTPSRTASQVAPLREIPTDRQPHTTTVASTSYRVVADQDQAGNTLVVGLPLDQVNETVTSLAWWSVLLTLLGVALAVLLGHWLVRRQLRPLHAVAQTAHAVSTQELATGDASIATRVPADLTDPQTEVGQVGSALNTMLDHVDDALAARHRSEQQVRQFVADASHELRTPLATIHGYAELSRRTPDDPAALSQALTKVETEAGRMSHLVEDLLLLARLDAGRPLAREEVDLTRLLLEAVADARVVAAGHHWKLELPEEPIVVIGDAHRLHQAISNLLGNARSHTDEGTTVTVRASQTGGAVRIDVHDDGPGLPAELVGEVFERFTRGDSSRTRSSGGAGLGLSLVAAITEAHGGRASVVSAPGSTTFSVELPARAPTP